MKIGRTGGFLLSPRTLNGVALVQLSQHRWYFSNDKNFLWFWWKLHCNVVILFYLILCTKESAFTTDRIQSYTLFFLHWKGNAVMIRSWILNFVQNQADEARCGCQQLGRLCHPHHTYGKQKELVLYGVLFRSSTQNNFLQAARYKTYNRATLKL